MILAVGCILFMCICSCISNWLNQSPLWFCTCYMCFFFPSAIGIDLSLMFKNVSVYEIVSPHMKLNHLVQWILALLFHNESDMCYFAQDGRMGDIGPNCCESAWFQCTRYGNRKFRIILHQPRSWCCQTKVVYCFEGMRGCNLVYWHRHLLSLHLVY